MRVWTGTPRIVVAVILAVFAALAAVTAQACLVFELNDDAPSR